MTLDLKELARRAGPIERIIEDVSPDLPEMVAGRVLHLDGDSAIYNCSGRDDTPLTVCKKRFRGFVADKMAQAGAEYANVCFTGGNHSKGGRYAIAKTKGYQEKRKGSTVPVNLAALREYALCEWQGGHKLIESQHDILMVVYGKDKIQVFDTHEEADDTLTQLHNCFTSQGHSEVDFCELSIVCAEDKDLFMNDGLFLDWNTGEIREAYKYGYIKPSETPGGTKKIIGHGKAFFFAQLLMGDTADNIPGLPYFTGTISALEFPDAKCREQARRLEEGTMPSGKPLTDKQKELAKETLSELVSRGREVPCGPVSVYTYLKSCTTEKEAFLKVLKAYVAFYGKDEEVDGEVWQPIHFLLEQGRLLWMRRTYGEDVKDYFKEIME